MQRARRSRYLAEYPIESMNSSSFCLSFSCSSRGFLLRLEMSMSAIFASTGDGRSSKRGIPADLV